MKSYYDLNIMEKQAFISLVKEFESEEGQYKRLTKVFTEAAILDRCVYGIREALDMCDTELWLKSQGREVSHPLETR